MHKHLYATKRMHPRQESVQKIRIGACSLVLISEVVADQIYPFPLANPTVVETVRARYYSMLQTTITNASRPVTRDVTL